MPAIGQAVRGIQLRDAIRKITDPDQWAMLLKIVGGAENDALSALSGQLTGRLKLTFEIASRSLHAESERKELRELEKLRDEIINAFDARRLTDLDLKGFTVSSPERAVKIAPNLTLEYDFVTGTASSGELRFHGVIATIGSNKPVDDNRATQMARVSDAELTAFCKKFLEGQSRIPSMESLGSAVRAEFPGMHVSRARIREMHSKLLPPFSRKSGPRK